MSSRRPAHIPKRKRIFLGCEGESERAYGQFIHRLSDREELSNHIDTVILHGGSPRTIVDGAIIKSKEREQRGSYNFKALLLDSDKLSESPKGAENEMRELESLASTQKIHLIWQSPCHEGFLLRHLPGCQTLNPPNSVAAGSELLKYWPEYRKPMPVNVLLDKISLEDLLRYAEKENSLNTLLKKIGF